MLSSTSSLAITTPSTSQSLALLLARVFSILAVVLVATWAISGDAKAKFLGGLNTSDKIFNWHPVLMILGMVGTSTFAVASYRTNQCGKRVKRLFHAFFQSMTLFFVALGLLAVFRSHNNASPPIANLYSLHSWIGLAATGLLVQNHILGFCHYLTPLLPVYYKRLYKPVHIFLGVCTYTLGIMAVLTGLMEKNTDMGCSYSVSEPDVHPASHYHLLPDGCKLSNGIAMVVLATFFFVMFGLYDFVWHRYIQYDEIRSF